MTGISQAFAGALLHFLWQGVAVASLFGVASLLLRRRSPLLRYATGCATLALMAALPVVTTWALYEPAGGLPGTAAPVAGPSSDPSANGIGIFGVLPAAGSLEMLTAWAIPIWALGVFLFSLRLLWGYVQVVRLRRSAGAGSETALATAMRLAGRMGVRRRFCVAVSSLAWGAGVVGWVRPLILLPSATALGLTPLELEAVLAHELAHIRRYDYLVNLAQSLVEALLFYHPAVWWVSSRIRRERELCCDDLAVAVLGDAIRYARALTALERLRLGAAQLAPGAADGSLSYRIRRLLGSEIEGHRFSLVSGIVALTLGAVVLSAASATAPRGEGATEESARTAIAGEGQWVAVPPFAAPEPLPARPAPPAAPAAPLPTPAPLPPAPSEAARVGQVAGQIGDEDGVAWVLFRDGRTVANGSAVDRAEARIRHRELDGDMMWVRVDDTTYVIRDADFLDGADALLAPAGAIDEDRRGLGAQMRALGDQMRALGDRMRNVRVEVPDLQGQLDQIRSLLGSDGSVADLGRLQAEIGQLQSQIGQAQGDAGRRQAEIGQEQAVLGRQQADLGREQAELGRRQGDAYRAAGERLVEMIRDAIGDGRAVELD